MKVFSAAFLCLQYGFVIYGQMEIDKKAACKMLLSILYFTVANKKEPFTIVKNIKLPPKTLLVKMIAGLCQERSQDRRRRCSRLILLR